MLGSINISEFVVDPFTSNAAFDFVSFEKCVKQSVIALNEVLDEGLPLHPLQEQKSSVRDWRQIGLGIMGLADMLIKMELAYGSNLSIKLCNDIGLSMINSAIEQSALLAKEDGFYPKYDAAAVMSTKFYNDNLYKNSVAHDLVKKYGLRNSQLLTIAPTGTLSTMLGISGGIEPIYANYYIRKTESLCDEEKEYKIYTPIVKEYLDRHNLKDDKDLPEYFITSSDIEYFDRINIQAVWQDHIDASISSTINLPYEATIDDVKNIYLYAHDAGLKGVTVFRNGCKRAPILSTDTKKKGQEPEKEYARGEIIKCSDKLIGKKRKLTTGCGSLHCQAFFDPVTGKLMETFLSRGSGGGCKSLMMGLSKMISISARGGVPIENIIDQLSDVDVCTSYAMRTAIKKDTSKGTCCPTAVGFALKDMADEMAEELKARSSDGEKSTQLEQDRKKIKGAATPKEKEFVDNKGLTNEDLGLCPVCKEKLIFEGGCNSCKNCGWSKCN